MKPDQYEHYSFVFDFFTTLAPAGPAARLLSALADLLSESARVVDVGGGTGLVISRLLDDRPDLQVTLLEPAAPMMRIAQRRLASPPHRLLPVTVEEWLDMSPSEAGPQAVLFSRALYAMYGTLTPYHTLFARISERLPAGGVVAIYELERCYDIPAQEAFYRAQVAGDPMTERLFQKLWPAMERALGDFNAGVTSGTFTLFTLDDLCHLAEASDLSVEWSDTTGGGHLLLARK